MWANIGRGCVANNFPLLTKEGYQLIGDLLSKFDENKPPEIITYDPLDFTKQTTNKVVLWDNGFQTIRQFKTHSGRTESLTFEHPLFVWKENSTSPEWIKAKDIAVGDLVASAKRLDIFNSTSIISNNEAKLIGYLWGDGAVSQPTKIGFINTTSEIVEDFSNLLAEEFPGYYLATHDKLRDYQYTIVGNNTNGSQPNLVRKRFRELNLMVHKAPAKRVPLCITSGTKETVANFLNGLFATDGYVVAHSTSPCIGIILSSKSFIEDIQRELIRFGIYSCIRYKKSKGGRSQIKDSECWVLEIRDQTSIRAFYNEIGITSKNDKIEELMNRFQGSCTTSNFNIYPKGVNLRIKALQTSKNIPWKSLSLDYHWNRRRLTSPKISKTAQILDDAPLQNLVSNFFWEPIIEITEDTQPTVGIEVIGTGIIGNPIISHNTKRFGKLGRKIAISSAWEPGDYIEKLYAIADKSSDTLGFRLKTWQVNLSLNNSEEAIKSSEDYINNPILAATEFEGIRTIKQGTFFIKEHVESAFKGYSSCDAEPKLIDEENSEGEIRHYAGIQLNRLVPCIDTVSFAHCDYGVKKDGAALSVCSPIQIENQWGVSVDVLMMWKPYIDKDKHNRAIKRIVSFGNCEDIFLQIGKARRVQKFSFDGFQSQGTIQKLHIAGFNTVEMSTATAMQNRYYTTTKLLMNQGLLILPKDTKWSITANLELQHIIELPNGKITHATYGKDLSDAICNSVYNCYLYMIQTGKLNNNSSIVANVSTVSNNNDSLNSTAISKAKNLMNNSIKKFKNN